MLFCDLVGFTAASERSDPEDVASRLRTYHRMLQERIDTFGGTVEKFIGDAVMAVFGAPVAHEDDAERAVRAGLRILESIDELNARDPQLGLAVRVGINTGEAIVALHARPESGEGFVTGDVVNTAARLQTAAPVSAVVVGRETYAATSRVFAYEPLEPVSVKGKAEPVALWRAGPPRARLGVDVLRSMDSPLVGRDLEVLQLRTAFDRVVRDRTVQLVTLTGEPGVGKSRLVAELYTYINELPDLVVWRQGRCLPYGDAVTFWALGEIVKSHAGVLESDNPEQTVEKLDAVLGDDAETGWLRARLLPLLGVDTHVAVPQEESFTAWRQFLESLADGAAAVVLVEDIHWADEALLAFLEYVAAWAHGVPLLLVCTARPELYELHPGWGTGLRNTMTVALSGLPHGEMATLVAQLLGRHVLPADTQQLILERAEGNPLYAEECVRVVREGGRLDAGGRLIPGADVPLPQGIQALIAARLDTLSADRKALLADAAVVGRRFWAGAIASMGSRDTAEVATALHELTSKELIRPSRESSMAGQQELSFLHGLVRDVAYSTIPRQSRAVRHLAAARWLEEKAAGRLNDIAEVLAHHTEQVLHLAGAAGDVALVAEVTPLARRHALLAADKASCLDAKQAMGLVDRALALTPPDDPDRPRVLRRWAEIANELGRAREAAEALENAVALFRAAGDLTCAGATMTELGVMLRSLGDDRGWAVGMEGLVLLEGQPPSPELVDALVGMTGQAIISGAYGQGVEYADRALALADQLGLPTPARGLGARGSCLVAQGAVEGLADQEGAITLLNAAGQGHAAGIAYNNLGVDRWNLLGPDAALETYAEGIAFADQRGLVRVADTIEASRLQALLETGRLADALLAAEALLPRLVRTGDSLVVETQAVLARVMYETGRPDVVVAEAALDQARQINTPDVMASAGVSAALTFLATGRPELARTLLWEVCASPGLSESAEYAPRLPAFVRCALAVGDVDLARRLTALLPANLPVREHAVVTASAQLAAAAGDHAVAVAGLRDAATRWAAFGNRLEQAYTLLELGRVASVAPGSGGPHEPLGQARRLFAEMEARPRMAECDRLLAGVRQDTA